MLKDIEMQFSSSKGKKFPAFFEAIPFNFLSKSTLHNNKNNWNNIAQTPTKVIQCNSQVLKGAKTNKFGRNGKV